MTAQWHADYQRKRYGQRKEWATALLGGKCALCDVTEGLEFDHVDPSTKSFVLSVGFSKFSKPRLEKELAKCQLLCRECHERKSTGEARSRPPWNKIGNHGKWTWQKGCTCADCMRHKSEYLAQRRVTRHKK